MTITLDPHDLTRARSDAPLLNDLEKMMPHLMRTVDRIQAGEPLTLSYDDGRTDDGPLTPAKKSRNMLAPRIASPPTSPL